MMSLFLILIGSCNLKLIQHADWSKKNHDRPLDGSQLLCIQNTSIHSSDTVTILDTLCIPSDNLNRSHKAQQVYC